MPYEICVTCGKEFHISPSRKGIRKNCSFDCKYQFMSETHVPWNKGIPCSDETKEKIAQKKRGRKLNYVTGFYPGMVPWNKGISYTLKSDQMMLPVKVPKPKYEGERHWQWKGGISRADKNERTKFLKYHVPKILARDDYTCFSCNDRGGCLHVDHIKRWADYPELRFDYNNCRTVCKSCHYKITFGRDMPSDSKWGLSSIPHDLGE